MGRLAGSEVDFALLTHLLPPTAAATLGFVLCGPPGGGKGTIAKKMVADFRLLTLGTGDMIRQEITSNSAVSRGSCNRGCICAGRCLW